MTKEEKGIPGAAAQGVRASALLVMGLCLLLTISLRAQDQGKDQKQDPIPDAPSSVRPIPPPEPPSPRPGADQSDDNASQTGESSSKGNAEEPPRSDTNPAPQDTNQTQPPPQMPPIKTVPAGSVPKDKDTGEALDYVIRSNVNLVQVPVTVKDADGRMVNGLLPKDFTVLENGQRQQLKFFTSDPFSISAAVIIDLGMPDEGLRKVQQTLPALQGAFTPYDEVAIYTYSTTAGRISDYGGVGKQLTAVLNQVKSFSGTNNGPPVTSGPLGPQGPIINGIPIDQPVTPVSTPPRVAHVLNDAVLLAARDLSKRPRERRKVIFIISDGRELGSSASYKDTLKVLQTQQITVYALGLESAATPIYGRIQRIHLPKTTALLGYSDILPKYVSATGGGTVYNEIGKGDIERAYSAALGDARNQYTLGYTSKGIAGYREIEVRVHRRDVKVYAKQGYYPLPAPR
ncbi:MAG TPA: VWA domain-containing protein [Terriglobales bacterium]|nr:VWA domain-containing protein [Terriglobales bacterium]